VQLRGDQIGPGVDRRPVPVIAVTAAGGPEERAPGSWPVRRRDRAGEVTVLTRVQQPPYLGHLGGLLAPGAQPVRDPGREHALFVAKGADAEQPDRPLPHRCCVPVGELPRRGEPLAAVDRAAQDDRLIPRYVQDIRDCACLGADAAQPEPTGDPVGDAPGRTVVGRVGDENDHDCHLPKRTTPSRCPQPARL